jgi:hypothetical protein
MMRAETSEVGSVVTEDRAKRVGVTSATTGVSGVSSNSYRRRRFAIFLELLEQVAAAKPAGAPIRVLDIGGVKGYWEGLQDLWGHLPLDITIVNIGAEAAVDGRYRIEGGDACALPHPDQSFDLIHSNSVIEHVGTWAQMAAMAREVARLAPRYFVQTPNFWFPFEPHYRTLFFHWWPETVRARMLMRKARGFHTKKASLHEAMEDVQSVALLSAAQMAALFPDATIRRETVFGFTKSLIAVR